ncbi:MAG: anhydro-N-acetylmuramic acid kinase [Alphaproteobacteria bacterium]|nr:anhydro-N-acetylmuramic acid kinase [Alphaproteobacteria bacterium]
MWVLGLMSGTSMDGIDAALLETDGERVTAFGPTLTRPYDEPFRERLRDILGLDDPSADLVRDLTLRHAEAVKALLAGAGQGADLIGFHGHTVLHRPEEGKTLQIGDGALLAEMTGIDVVGDFRSADVAAGGQGAPLVPVYHAALAASLEKPLAVLNIGGVANVTYIGPHGGVLAFDTGPGNALIDDWMLAMTGYPIDENGALAQEGHVDEAAVSEFIEHSWFAEPPPKSLDRDEFALFAKRLVGGMSPADGAATLCALTVAAVARAERHLPRVPRRWLVSGGGRKNPVLMSGLRFGLGVSVEPVEEVGWNGDALEAQAFAYLAARSLAGLPISYPSTTGVKEPMTGGRLFKTG